MQNISRIHHIIHAKLTDILVHRQTNLHTNNHTNNLNKRQTSRHRDKQTNKQTDKQTDRQTDKLIQTSGWDEILLQCAGVSVLTRQSYMADTQTLPVSRSACRVRRHVLQAATGVSGGGRRAGVWLPTEVSGPTAARLRQRRTHLQQPVRAEPGRLSRRQQNPQEVQGHV